jgi:hypothetical protein
MTAIAIALTSLLGFLVIFQILLALGFPLGKAAWGGQHKVLPTKLRIASGISVAVFIFAILIVLSKAEIITLFATTLSTVVLWILTVYFGIGIVMNAISRSKIERIWAPVVAAMCLLSLLMLI